MTAGSCKQAKRDLWTISQMTETQEDTNHHHYCLDSGHRGVAFKEILQLSEYALRDPLRGLEYSSVVECLPCKPEAPGSISSTKNKNQKHPLTENLFAIKF